MAFDSKVSSKTLASAMLERARAKKLAPEQDKTVKREGITGAQKAEQISATVTPVTSVPPTTSKQKFEAPQKLLYDRLESLPMAGAEDPHKNDKKERKSRYETLAMAVSPDEARIVRSLAKRLNLTVSEWCRRLIWAELRRISDEGKVSRPPPVTLHDALDNLRPKVVRSHKKHAYTSRKKA